MDLKIKRYIAIFAQIIDLPRMKTIVTVFGWAEMGKTSALKCLAEQFGCEFTTSPWDIFQMFDYNGHLIGIASEGDPGSCQKDNIYKMIEAGCEVIVCASRTKGRTTENVMIAAKNNGYRLIWTSHYSIYRESLCLIGLGSEEIDKQNVLLNKTFAKNIKNLIDDILFSPIK